MPPSKTTKKTPAKKTAQSRARTKPTVVEEPSPVQPETIQVQDPAGQDAKYAPTAWGNESSTGPTDLECPSGQLCLVKRPGVQGLMQAGVLHNIDRLTAIVGKKHLKKGKDGEQNDVAVAKLMGDPEKLAEVMHTVDRVVCHVVVKPEIHMTPNDPTSRNPHAIYADMVDLLDKMFIFNFVVGGSRDLESFRGGLAGLVGGMESGEDVQVSP